MTETQSKLFKNADDFKACIDRGMEIMMDPINAVPPEFEDLEKMRALLSIFITATMNIDQTAHQQDFSVKITSVRMALLAAYNLGKQTK